MMVTIDFIEYEDASPEVRQVYDDIMTTRKAFHRNPLTLSSWLLSL